ncbi:MAG: tRNA pseudouridine(55) synthase TruB [Nostocaceae cyanobacterium]|nr:tRNA pseudouridine(55) synthase TruB [Nostocaceae cyanobacterium]
MQGFLNLNKPFSWTSHDCVVYTRKLFRLKRIGHGGTLDPAATGVLPIALGKATRLLQYLPSEKAYKATIRLGVCTTTDDLEGKIISQTPVMGLSLETVTNALKQFVGKIEQIPPAYSAIQVQGKRLYELARKGEVVEVPMRTVEVSRIEILDWRPSDYPELDVAISCGSGTYIRAIARDLGAVLETGGTLSALCRTFSSGFPLADSLRLSELETQVKAGIFQPIPADVGLQHLPCISLVDAEAVKWRQGQRVGCEENVAGETLRVYDGEGRFLGIGKFQEDLLIPAMVYEPMS